MIKITTLLKCILPCLMLTFYSCDFLDEGNLFLRGKVYETAECNLSHSLDPSVSKEVDFQVIVRNVVGESLQGVLLNFSFRMQTCDGRIIDLPSQDISTDEDGVARGFVSIDFTWDNDFVDWTVSVPRLDFEYAGYTERFGLETNLLHTIIKIAELDD